MKRYKMKDKEMKCDKKELKKVMPMEKKKIATAHKLMNMKKK